MKLSENPANPGNKNTPQHEILSGQNRGHADVLASNLNQQSGSNYTNYQKYKSLEKVILTEQEILRLLSNPIFNAESAQNIIYDFLTKKNEYFIIKDKLQEFYEKNEKPRKWYNTARDQIEQTLNEKGFKNSSNAGWLGINTNPNIKLKTNHDFKTYTTLPTNQYGFIRHIPDLVYRLNKLSQRNSDPIKIKFPYSFTGFAFHNDSIVVHYKKKETGEQILSIIDDWLRSNDIQQAPREFKRSRIAVDKDGESFSNLVAKNIATWLDQNNGKYDNQTLAKGAIHYAIQLSQKIFLD